MILRQLTICSLVLLGAKNVRLQDPCKEARMLGNLGMRCVGYELADDEAFLSDYRLTPGWYKLPTGYTLALNSTECGTFFNWWLREPLPIKEGEVMLQICQNDGDKDCAQSRQINVRKCPDGYVYQLPPTDADMEAYCIESNGTEPPIHVESAPDISAIRPTISADVVKDGRDHKSVFYCDFKSPDNTYVYDVEWSLHSGVSKLASMKLSDGVKYENEQKFREQTKLTETDLKKNLVFKPGFTIVCSVVARKSIFGKFSSSQDSPPKYFGIRILSELFHRLKQTEQIVIELELTIPFGCIRPGCPLELDMLVPNENTDKCLLSNLAQTGIHQDGKYCGVKFDKVNQKVNFSISATFGQNQGTPTSRVFEMVFTTQHVNHNHRFFQDYQLPTITIELEVDQTPLRGKRCYSVSDPHMLTFDGTAYDNQHLGTYIMYRHTELQAEIQTQTTPCKRDGVSPFCNCGVAVRAGKDVFLINNCNKVMQPPRTVYCQDGVLYRRIKKENPAVYTITLPHGTKVSLTIGHSFNNMINVHIYPSLTDLNRSEGLCGMFDNDRGNDKLPRKGWATDFRDSWRVTKDENLFESFNYQNLKGWSEDAVFCSCSHSTLNSFNPETVCSTDRMRKCRIESGISNPRQNMCDRNTRRRRRDSGGIIFDSYADPTTAFHSTKQMEDKPAKRHETRVKRQVTYTNATARAECLQMMNTSTFQKCDKIPDIGIAGMIDNCVLDAMLTNTMDWTMSHLESIKQTCLQHVEVTQPLPPEVRAQLVVLPDVNSTEDNNGTREYPTLPPPTNPPLGTETITPELLSEIKEESCPNECSGHGQCENGTCTCDAPFGSFDCSLNVTQPPIMMGIPDKGQCDLQQRRCAETAVFGQNFAETDALSCRLQHFVIDTNNTIQHGNTSDVRGHFESMFEVYCPLPESRSKRSVPNDLMTNDALAYGYQASVSNDGNTFSEGDTIVIYDSRCVSCSKLTDANKIACTRKAGKCVRNGHCYEKGETTDCYTCADDGGGDVTWSNVCAVNANTPSEAVQTWVIGVVAGSCVLITVVIIALVCYICKRNTSRRKVNDSKVFIKRH